MIMRCNFLSRQSLFALAWTAVGLAACTGTFRQGATGEAEYHVTTNRPSSQVTVSHEANSAIVDPHSVTHLAT